ncbi:hypothetical protein ACIGFK_07365 [Streptomyces sp. NPDC085524]|uniref:hypothetical protein n=1 Tax=unclassified Streptomyces TaxID=2593676 RepID=UPI0035E31245
MGHDSTPVHRAIRPQLTADGLAVRLPVAHRADPLLDELALAYAETPEAVGLLLAEHAGNVLALDFAVCGEDVPDHERAMRAAAADGTRDALLDEMPSADHLDDTLSAASAIRLAGELTALAARIGPAVNGDRP